MNKQRVNAEIKAEYERHYQALKDLRAKQSDIRLRDQRSNQDRYKARKDLLDKTGRWLQENAILKVGDIIQVTGSRAGKYRTIIEFTSNGVIGNVSSLRRVKKPNGSFIRMWKTNSLGVTEQGMNKITHILREDKFIPIKDLMNGC
jgi:hypothetical protein